MSDASDSPVSPNPERFLAAATKIRRYERCIISLHCVPASSATRAATPRRRPTIGASRGMARVIAARKPCRRLHLQPQTAAPKSVSDRDMRASAQSHPERGHTLYDASESSPPDFQEQYCCTSFTSPSSTSVRGMIARDTGSTWGSHAAPRTAALTQPGATDASPSL
jgi:hypothetical protein